MSSHDVEVMARQIAALTRIVKGLAKTQQVSRSVVITGDGEAATVGELLSGAADTAQLTNEHSEDLARIDEGDALAADALAGAGSAADIADLLDVESGYDGLIDDGVDSFDHAMETDEATHAADMTAIGANLVVDQALAAAEAASEEALAAKTSADGKNRIFAQMIEPVAHPEIPFVAGDLWYETDSSGRFVNVHVWNETEAEFVQHRIVASSVLVPGSVGPVLIEDGAVTGAKIAATAIDGKTITGALMRTGASGQRMQFDSAGLRAFNASNAVTASLSAASGGLDLAGNLVSRNGVLGTRAVLGEGALRFLDDLSGDQLLIETYSNMQLVKLQSTRIPGIGPDVTRAAILAVDGPDGAHLRLGDGSSTDPRIRSYGGGELEILTGTAVSKATFGTLVVRSHTQFKGDVEFDGDTNWLSISLTNSWGGTLEVKQKAGVVFFQGSISKATFSGSYEVVGTLPGSIPAPSSAKIFSYVVGSGSANILCNMQVNATGNILVRRTSATTLVVDMGCISYPVG